MSSQGGRKSTWRSRALTSIRAGLACAPHPAATQLCCAEKKAPRPQQRLPVLGSLLCSQFGPRGRILSWSNMRRILSWSNMSTSRLRQRSASELHPRLSSSWRATVMSGCWNGASGDRSLGTWVSAWRRAWASPSDLAQNTNHFLVYVASEISGLLPSRASSTWPVKLYNSLPSIMLDPERNWNCKAVSAFKKLTKLLHYMPREGFLNRWPGWASNLRPVNTTDRSCHHILRELSRRHC